MKIIIVNRKLLIKLAIMISVLALLFSFPGIIYTDAVNSYRLPMKNRVIIIDPGHGGIDPGAVSRTGVAEDDINLNIALRLRILIEQSGGVGLMTRDNDNGLYSDGTTRIRDKYIEDLRTRHRIINSSGADIFISIHLNFFPQSQYYGAQCFYHKGKDDCRKLAELIQYELVDVIQNQNIRKAKSIDTLYILKNNKMPGALVECGFLSNPQEEKLLQEDKYQDKVAWGIFMGIMRYFQQEK